MHNLVHVCSKYYCNSCYHADNNFAIVPMINLMLRNVDTNHFHCHLREHNYEHHVSVSGTMLTWINALLSGL